MMLNVYIYIIIVQYSSIILQALDFPTQWLCLRGLRIPRVQLATFDGFPRGKIHHDHKRISELEL